MKIYAKIIIFNIIFLILAVVIGACVISNIDIESKGDSSERISVIKQDKTVGQNANIYILHDNDTGTDVLYIDNWYYSDSSAVRLTEGE